MPTRNIFKEVRVNNSSEQLKLSRVNNSVWIFSCSNTGSTRDILTRPVARTVDRAVQYR